MDHGAQPGPSVRHFEITGRKPFHSPFELLLVTLVCPSSRDLNPSDWNRDVPSSATVAATSFFLAMPVSSALPSGRCRVLVPLTKARTVYRLLTPYWNPSTQTLFQRCPWFSTGSSGGIFPLIFFFDVCYTGYLHLLDRLGPNQHGCSRSSQTHVSTIFQDYPTSAASLVSLVIISRFRSCFNILFDALRVSKSC